MNRTRGIVLAVTLLVSVLAGTAGAMHFSPWGTAQKIDEIPGWHPDLNTAFVDGCPIQSPDGLSLYMASNRPGGLGGLGIWVARRDTKDGPAEGVLDQVEHFVQVLDRGAAPGVAVGQ